MDIFSMIVSITKRVLHHIAQLFLLKSLIIPHDGQVL